MQGFVVFFMFAAGFGFHQSLGWNIIQIIFGMAAMVPGAALFTDKTLHPATRALFNGDDKYTTGFLIAVSLLAFVVFSIGDIRRTNFDNEITRYCTIWWVMFPVTCLGLLALDQFGHAFGSRRNTWTPPIDQKVTERWPYDVQPDKGKDAEFDPKRFR